MTLWMEVTRDEYELPIAVSTSVKELAELRKTTPGAIRSAMNKYKKRMETNKKKKPLCRYVKVEIEEDDDEK